MQTGYEDEREIDLLDILWEMFIQWKPMLLCGLIVAVLAMAFMYVKDLRTYKADLEEYQKNLDMSEFDFDAEIERVSEELTAAEVATVENTLYTRGLMAKTQEKLDLLLDKGLDVDDLEYRTLRYAVSTNELPVSSVQALYSDKINNDILRKKIYKESKTYDEDLNNVISVMSMSYSNTDEATFNTFYISLLVLDGVDGQLLEKTVRSYVEDEVFAEVARYIPHDLEYLYTNESKSNNKGMQDTITSYQTDIMGKRLSIARDETAFTDDQKILYKYTLMRNGELSYADVEKDIEAIKKTSDDEEESAVSDSVEDIEEIKEPVPPGRPSVKYFLIGFVAGCFMYAVALVLIYMLRGKVRTLGEVTDCYRIRGLDEVHERRIETMMERFLYSRRVYDFRYRKAEKEIGIHVDAAVGHACELALHNGIKHVTVVPTYSDAANDGLCAKYVDNIKSSWNIESVPMDLAEAWTTDETRTDPGEKEGLLLLLRAGDTTFKTLERIAAYCRDYSVGVIGAVLLEG